MLKRLKASLDANIDYGAAVIAAAILGSIVFALNRVHGPALAATAALKQATYTFFVAGFIAKNNERLACRWPSTTASLLAASTVSTCIAVGLTFLVHSLRGTPEPLLSTLPTALLGPPGFFFLGRRAREALQGDLAGATIGS